MSEIVIRPNGKIYRARRAPRAEVVDDDGDGMVIVWGTHDVDVATALAGVEWHREGWGSVLPGQSRQEFCHVVPWDAYGMGYDFSIIRTSPDRGTPCVTFDHPRRLRSGS